MDEAAKPYEMLTMGETSKARSKSSRRCVRRVLRGMWSRVHSSDRVHHGRARRNPEA
jgi:hypothetical protein